MVMAIIQNLPKLSKERVRNGIRDSLKTTHRIPRITIRELKSLIPGRSSRTEVRGYRQGKSDQAARPISTGRLKASRLVHVQPIKRVVCPWSSGSLRSGKQYLGRSLALRCFQRLSLPHMATQ